MTPEPRPECLQSSGATPAPIYPARCGRSPHRRRSVLAEHLADTDDPSRDSCSTVWTPESAGFVVSVSTDGVRAVAPDRQSVSRRLPTDPLVDEAVSCGPRTASVPARRCREPVEGDLSRAPPGKYKKYWESPSCYVSDLSFALAGPLRPAGERTPPPTAQRRRRLVGRRPRRPASSDRGRRVELARIYNYTVVNHCGPAGLSGIEKSARRDGSTVRGWDG